MRKIVNVKRDNDTIYIHNMDHPVVVSRFIEAVMFGRKAGHTNFNVKIKDIDRTYPDVCDPMAGITEYLFDNEGIRFTYSFEDGESYVSNSCIDAPLLVKDNEARLNRSSLDVVWKFRDFEEVQQLVNKFVDHISQLAVCESGVIEGLTWCLNEVMDNVL